MYLFSGSSLPRGDPRKLFGRGGWVAGQARVHIEDLVEKVEPEWCAKSDGKGSEKNAEDFEEDGPEVYAEGADVAVVAGPADGRGVGVADKFCDVDGDFVGGFGGDTGI